MRVGDDGEVEHVYNLAVEEAGVTAGFWQEVRDVLLVGVAVFEDEAVEHTVDEIAEGACENEGTAIDEAGVIFFADEIADDEYAGKNCYETK